MTTELLDQRIKALNDEKTKLAAMHEGMVAQFQKTAGANMTRYQQIVGALAELTDLKKQMNGAQE